MALTTHPSLPLGLKKEYSYTFNHLNAELNPICHLLALLGAHHILHVGRLRFNPLCVFMAHYTVNNFIVISPIWAETCSLVYID
jgi:hypothetical protein